MPDLVNKAIKTLAFFHNFEHPLTPEELHRYLWKESLSFKEFQQQLDKLKQSQALDCSQSFFYLRDNKEDIKTRQERVKIIKDKTQIAKKAARKLRWIPFLKAIFICNTLSAKTATEDSDIDFFIVAQQDRVWLVRFFANIVLKLFGLRIRINADKIKDKICLTFFTSINRIDLSKVAIDQPDIYLVYWIQQLYPLYDPDNYYKEIIQANDWIKNYTPNCNDNKKVVTKDKVEPTRLSKTISKVLTAMWQGSYGDILETQSRKLQEYRLKSYLGHNYENNEPNVIIKKNIIKLHKDDKRKEFKQNWKQTYKKYLHGN